MIHGRTHWERSWTFSFFSSSSSRRRAIGAMTWTFDIMLEKKKESKKRVIFSPTCCMNKLLCDTNENFHEIATKKICCNFMKKSIVSPKHKNKTKKILSFIDLMFSEKHFLYISNNFFSFSEPSFFFMLDKWYSDECYQTSWLWHAHFLTGRPLLSLPLRSIWFVRLMLYVTEFIFQSV